MQSEVEHCCFYNNIVLVKPHSLRHKEILNGLNQVKGSEQSLNGVNNAPHLKNVNGCNK